MIRSQYALCAESIVTDKETGVISIFNILEQISAEGFPLHIQKLGVVNQLLRDDGDPEQITVNLQIKLNDNNLYNFNGAIDFKGAFRSRLVANINGLQIPGPGKLSFNFDYDGNRIGSYVIEVVKIGGPQAKIISE